MVKKDLVIIGAGPAGLTAAIYGARRGLSTLLVSKDLGGQATTTPHIENYPGISLVHGRELMTVFLEQAKKAGADYLFDVVLSVEKMKDKNFLIKTPSRTIFAQSVILTFGKSPTSLELENEHQLIGKGLSYSVSEEILGFKGKTVAIVGGGNSAIEGAALASPIAKEVHLIHRRREFRAEAILLERLKALNNIVYHRGFIVTKLVSGKGRLQAIEIEKAFFKAGDFKPDGRPERLRLDGLFVQIGYGIKADFVKKLVEFDENQEVLVNRRQETSLEGVFAAGDLTQNPYKQIVISAGEGASAALSAFEYIMKKQGRPAITIDWGTWKDEARG